MNRCEDYPCCGHGPAPYGDGGGCPDENGQFMCVMDCGSILPRGARSSICEDCQRNPATFCDQECPGCRNCDPPEDDRCNDEDDDRAYRGGMEYDAWSFE